MNQFYFITTAYALIIVLANLTLVLNFKYSIYRHRHVGLKQYREKADYTLPQSSSNLPLSQFFSELPNTFEDAITIAAKKTIECINTESFRCRIDFDTTVGDMTYTSLSTTMPVMKELCNRLAVGLDLTLKLPKIYAPEPEPEPELDEVDAQLDDLNNQSYVSLKSNTADDEFTIALMKEFDDEPKNIWEVSDLDYAERTMVIFFPDMGAAALARRDWKMNTIYADVPPCVRTAAIQSDPILPTDKLAVILCPLYSEVDYVKRVLDACDASGIPCVIINPNIINMDQGFGVRK
jgi:hypothetical protein